MAGRPPSGQGHGQTSLNPLGIQFFSSLEGLEVITSADRQLIRGHNLVGAVRLQFVRPTYFDEQGGEHAELLDGRNDLDIPLSMHVYPFPNIEEWDSQWFFFDVQLHPYQLQFRRKVVDGDESVVGSGRAFHILAYMPYDQQLWKSWIGWMKNSAEGGFVARKWVYGRGSIIGVLNAALLEKEPEPGHDVLVVLVDEFGFTLRATFDSGGSTGSGLSPQKTRPEPGIGRSPFSSSPVGPSSRRPSVLSSAGMGKVKERSGGEAMEEAESSAITKRLFALQQDQPGSTLNSKQRDCTEIESSVTVLTGSEENEAPNQGRNPLKRGAGSGRDGTLRKRVSSWKVQDAQETIELGTEEGARRLAVIDEALLVVEQ
ncbi:hypothetical protein B0J13DRAFT_531274 [Dactylonectria estremocensis]|uniref:Uncharacterized protein n=1 Tax=Dactylonectria estremocensis TaxID=1079267 RepID=A0A9P9DQT3_9HYPO|nr:hypothetical protein B0J13DRAFT_531274 [Dactylonectria estremocensis]